MLYTSTFIFPLLDFSRNIDQIFIRQLNISVFQLISKAVKEHLRFLFTAENKRSYLNIMLGNILEFEIVCSKNNVKLFKLAYKNVLFLNENSIVAFLHSLF